MKEIKIDTVFTVYNSFNELPEEVKGLMQEAVKVRKKAYAPYSKFKVGAAIELDNSQVVLGSNQENAAFPSGLCAERTAIFHVGAVYPEARIIRLAISAASDIKLVTSPIPPCGACRQSMVEYELKQDTPIEMFFMGEEGEIYYSKSIQNLLPFVFDKNFL